LTEKLVFFSTDWGYTHGGISAVNIDLCKAVARIVVTGVEVVCVVPSATSEKICNARESRVRLVGLETKAEEWRNLRGPALARLKEEFRARDVVWWIGHDVVTGHWAEDACRELESGKVALIHHMDYEAYKDLQLDEGEHAEEWIKEQNSLLLSVDVILAVGPKLLLSAKDKVRGRNVEIKEIIPGLPQVESLPPFQEGFSAIAMGRLERQNSIIKQLKLAAHAFGHAVGCDRVVSDKHPSLTVLGVSKDDLATQHRELLAEVADRAGRVVPVHARPYERERSTTLEALRHHSVSMMLSLTEGFGLVGWEAIGAAVPLIVSKNSGVYETIEMLFGGGGTGCLHGIDIRGSVDPPYYHEKDLTEVSDALCRIARDPVRAKEDALRLRTSIEQACTWPKAAEDFCSALNVRTLNLSRLAFPNTAVHAATREDLQFQALWDGLKPPSRFHRFILLFGGISSALSDERAFEYYSTWLLNNPAAELFICYEAGPSALARARELDPTSIEADATAELPRETEARMLLKEAKVRSACETFSRRLENRRDRSADRFRFAAVYEPLTAYVMVADDELFVTPLMSRRSSESLSFLLAKRPIQFPLDVLNYVIYNLEKLEPNEIVSMALSRLSALIETEYARE
jgi:glycosyltransferase involved in cell wall biosynthesis